MRVIVLAALSTMMLSLPLAHARELNLSAYFDELVLRAQKAESSANAWRQSSKQLSSELELALNAVRSLREKAESLKQEAESLSSDLNASRLSEQQAWEQAKALSEKLSSYETLLSEAGKESEQQALEISALKSDRDGWEVKARRRGRGILYASGAGLVLALIVYVVGLAQ